MANEGSQSVFLSYASQDTEAAQKICQGLRAAGIEVWFDQSELRGGDAWDQSIRRQIRDCTLFIPVISATTQGRHEGYFRLEWHLAEQRSHLIARGRPFIVPVAIDGTSDAEALVPDSFLSVQWMRLPGGVPTPDFVKQMRRLVEGHAPSAPARSPAPAVQPRLPLSKGKLFAIGLLAAAAVAAAAVFMRNRNSVVATPSVATAAASAPSSAREQALRAKAMFMAWNSTADDFAAAEGLVKEALRLDPNDGEIYAVSSLLNSSYFSRGFDQTEARKAQSRSDAERGLRLAPDSVDTQYAKANWDYHYASDPSIARDELEKLLARNPDFAAAQGELGALYTYVGRTDEGLALLEKSASNPDHAALSRYVEFLDYFRKGQFEDADRVIRQSIASGAASNNVTGLAMLQLTWKGDAAAAAKCLAAIPPGGRIEHRTIWITAFIQLCNHAPEEAIATLAQLPDDYIVDNWYVGPKAYWEGRAEALAGRSEAARASWESGLTLIESRLKTAQADRNLHLMRGLLLALLGRKDEALMEAHTTAEMPNLRGPIPWCFSPVIIYAELGLADPALALLPPMLRQDGSDRGWPLTAALMRADPLWDKLRADPRVQSLMSDMDEREQASAPQRDWPKDPDLKRAIGLITSLKGNADGLGAAVDLTKGVLAQRPTDAEAATVMARLQVWYLVRGFDRSPARFVEAKRACQYALQLAPDEPEAMVAMGMLFDHEGANYARAKRLFDRAIELEPQNPLYRRMRASLLADDPGIPRIQAVAAAKRSAELFPNDPLVVYDASRVMLNSGILPLAECEASMKRVVTLYPLPNALSYLAWIALVIHEDPQGMKQWLDRVPEDAATSERIIFSRACCALVTRKWDDGVDALNAEPDSWMEDFDYSGPPAYLKGLLLQQMGKLELAQLQFKSALADFERHKANQPAQPWHAEPWLLHALGRDEEARASNHLNFESLDRPYLLKANTTWFFSAIPAALILGERDEAITLIREASRHSESREVIKNALVFDWRLSSFRNDPQIRAIIDGTDASAGKN